MYSTKIFLFFVLFSVLLSVLSELENNVCKSVDAYFEDIQNNPNCWHDSDLNKSPEQIAKNHGFLMETHVVRTSDGYILKTFRLKSGKGVYGKRPIFFQHGLTTDCRSLLLNGNKSLALLLSKHGFDVWIGNFRGTIFSSHATVSTDDTKFFDFSFHEHGLFDVSANLKYIYETTKRKIVYIGHSMGGTSLGVYASMNPEESKKYITHAVLLCGAFYFKYTNEYGKMIFGLMDLIKSLNIHALFQDNSFETRRLKPSCLSNIDYANMCYNIADQLMGPSITVPIPPEKYPLGLSIIHNVCVKAALHYSQLMQTDGEFRMFDYGADENMRRYNSIEPPSYNLSNILIPVTLIYAEFDNLATKKDTTLLFQKYQKKNWDIIEIPKYSHATILFDPMVETRFLPILLKSIIKYI